MWSAMCIPCHYQRVVESGDVTASVNVATCREDVKLSVKKKHLFTYGSAVPFPSFLDLLVHCNDGVALLLQMYISRAALSSGTGSGSGSESGSESGKVQGQGQGPPTPLRRGFQFSDAGTTYGRLAQSRGADWKWRHMEACLETQARQSKSK